MAMTRRDFLMTAGMAATVGGGAGLAARAHLVPFIINKTKEVIDGRVQQELAKRDAEEESRRRFIYEILPEHVHVAQHIMSYFSEEKEEGGYLITKGRAHESNGCGIILKDHYLTMGHISESLNGFIPQEKKPAVSKKVISSSFLDGEKLEEVVSINKGNMLYDGEAYDDIGIYKLPKTLDIKEFPCKLSSKIDKGDEIYIIGNPGLLGARVRKAEIISEDISKNKMYSQDLSTKVFEFLPKSYPGDSGCPIINSDLELIGLSVSYVNYPFRFSSWEAGLGIRIDEFLKYIET